MVFKREIREEPPGQHTGKTYTTQPHRPRKIRHAHRGRATIL